MVGVAGVGVGAGAGIGAGVGVSFFCYDLLARIFREVGRFTYYAVLVGSRYGHIDPTLTPALLLL